jgi:hypothetical protein
VICNEIHISFPFLPHGTEVFWMGSDSAFKVLFYDRFKKVMRLEVLFL